MNTDVLCAICLQNTSFPSTIGFDCCVHRFCCSCMNTFVGQHCFAQISCDRFGKNRYLREKLKENIIEMKCPGACGTSLPGEVVMAICGKSQALSHLLERANISKVISAISPHYLQCPFNECRYVVWTAREPVPSHYQSLFARVLRRSWYKRSPDGCDRRRFSCALCQHESCVLCARPWTTTCETILTCHDAISCKEYRRRVVRSAQVDFNLLSDKWKRRKGCKECPNCGIWIEKLSGCDSMYCLRCRHSFCWRCRTLADDHSHGYRRCHKR